MRKAIAQGKDLSWEKLERFLPSNYRMQTWGEFKVGDFVIIVNYSPFWDGTIAQIIEIDTDKSKHFGHVACKLHYLEVSDGHISPTALLHTVTEDCAWYLDDGHIQKLFID